jgi:hypothetical protein
MSRSLGAIILGAVVSSATMLCAADDQKTQIKGGIEGKVKKVDAEGNTLTITTDQGRERTFSISDETTIVGPRGGKVRHRLKDPRFHEGMSLTIVADGNTAKEVHLGFQHREGDATSSTPRADRATRPAGTEAPDRTARKTIEPPRGALRPAGGERATPDKATVHPADADDDTEVPGKVKRFDATRRMLVVTLLNGTDRSFLLSRDVKVLVQGRASRQGLADPALRTGATIEVVTDEGGHKVKELKVTPAAPAQRRKAG